MIRQESFRLQPYYFQKPQSKESLILMFAIHNQLVLWSLLVQNNFFNSFSSPLSLLFVLFARIRKARRDGFTQAC